jgi:syntaxin-binding protein 5
LIGLPPNSIQTSFPNPLLDLTIDIKLVLADPSVMRRIPQAFLKKAEIEAVYFSTEALEMVVVLKTGEIIVYRLSGPQKPSEPKESSDKELIILDHVPSNSGFSAYFMVACASGHVEACAVSDVGTSIYLSLHTHTHLRLC